mmetsp:Transcript_129075/g.192309  ORF Transcript_129075/g.192309 Transcript_129075/m.192309 type:complete len:258 (-) Transcript_129075:18-791(-)|eukprot:CAMPEP_0117010850 /NCGR_PEP_ID=MMETSP0472-20121206/9457_1 /TAXON_ID=693140 ORGANISM="Tiarina fusus, Strain LIS" /NCGR_SAMPLE_ID=MMETSP0472 /ASSEMBLY_ACC=CAM_ASM_000603 /LENGTH=257 /DNA_ID=CAMNT_0004713485 /DNA_START=12 /DNA_END=785 /DNA_ORIENTATION=+
MARNEEKAQSMLNRYLQMKNKEAQGPTGPREKRPFLASQENNLGKAERWRRQVTGEIIAKVSEIQNETLAEARIRDLNDDINKLFREKGHWERRIRELGGANHHSVSLRVAQDEGVEVEGTSGYRYFGAAKKLKGVKELLQPEEDDRPRVNRSEMYKNIDADYYGYRDDDGKLVELEKDAETEMRAAAIKEWKLSRENIEMEDSSSDGEFEYDISAAVPTKDQMDQILLEKQKEEIMTKYAAPALQRAILAESQSSM